jgi:hypothetical protein
MPRADPVPVIFSFKKNVIGPKSMGIFARFTRKVITYLGQTPCLT